MSKQTTVRKIEIYILQINNALNKLNYYYYYLNWCRKIYFSERGQSINDIKAKYR